MRLLPFLILIPRLRQRCSCDINSFVYTFDTTEKYADPADFAKSSNWSFRIDFQTKHTTRLIAIYEKNEYDEFVQALNNIETNHDLGIIKKPDANFHS